MKSRIRIITALSILWLSLAAQTAHAQTCTVLCPKRAITERLVLEGIRSGVANAIDQSLFSDTKVQVRMRLLSFSPVDGVTIPVSSVLGGITIMDSGHPTGLAFGLEGDSAVSFSGECTYSYQVSITTRGKDLEENVVVNPKTESFITITTPLNGRVTCTK